MAGMPSALAGLDPAGTSNNQEQGSWEAALRQSGTSEDVIEQVRRGVQADLTRSRQKDTNSIRELQTQVSQITQYIQQGLPQQQAANQKPSYVKAIEDAGVDPNKLPELHKAFSSSGQAIVDEAVNRVVQQLAPHFNATYAQQQNQALESEKARLVKDYGEAVLAHWPQMEQEARGRLARGQGIKRMEEVLEDLNPSAMRELIYKSEHSRRIKEANNTTQSVYEGMQQTRRTTPLPTERQDTAQGHAIKPLPTQDDISRITREALAAAGLS